MHSSNTYNTNNNNNNNNENNNVENPTMTTSNQLTEAMYTKNRTDAMYTKKGDPIIIGRDSVGYPYYATKNHPDIHSSKTIPESRITTYYYHSNSGTVEQVYTYRANTSNKHYNGSKNNLYRIVGEEYILMTNINDPKVSISKGQSNTINYTYTQDDGTQIPLFNYNKVKPFLAAQNQNAKRKQSQQPAVEQGSNNNNSNSNSQLYGNNLTTFETTAVTPAKKSKLSHILNENNEVPEIDTFWIARRKT